MCDPFPKDECPILEYTPPLDPIDIEEESLIYAPCRYLENMSPTTLYIPEQSLMLKMMRACIDVRDVEDLWFNLEEDLILDFSQMFDNITLETISQ